jgi:hypothetical protein
MFLHGVRDVVMKDRGARRQLPLRKERTSGRFFWKIIELDIEKLIVESSFGLWEVSDWRLRRGRPPSKRKKRHQKHSPWKRKMAVHLDRLAPYKGATRDERP